MKSVVVIDRAFLHRARMSRTIRALGTHEVAEFRDDASALPFVMENGAACVLLDVPQGCDELSIGWTSFTRKAPHCPLVIMTDGDLRNGRAQPLPPGATISVNKNASPSVLRKTLKNLLRDAEHRVSLSNRDEDQNEFLRHLIDDLRTPIRHARQLVDQMQDLHASGDMAELARMLERQRDAAHQTERLIDALGTFAHLTNGTLYGAVDLSEAARLARAGLSGEIAARRAKVDIGELPVITGSLEDITLLFSALIDNGLRHSSTDEPRIDIRHRDAEQIEIVVSDNGIGIAEHERELAFAPLKRLQNSSVQTGSGMGLAIARRIMERHGGQITCGASSGAGCAMTLTFPVPRGVFGVAD